MASLRNGALGSALLLTAVVVLAPACDDDPRIEGETGGSAGSAGSSKGGSSAKGGSTSKAGATGEGGAGGAGTAACKEIGSLCHDAESDPLGAECHELGHTGDGTVCLERYDECIDFCTEYLAGPGGGAAQGHGGGGGESHVGAGGHGGG
jgi:hypothetical protein